MADRCCASFLTMCQPLKFAFCSMDSVQLSLLMFFWLLGMFCFQKGMRAFKAGDSRQYQICHTLWHVFLPLGGYLWIEYTRYYLLSSRLGPRPTLPGAEQLLEGVKMTADVTTSQAADDGMALLLGGASPDCQRAVSWM
eukprot:TRINITY_DN35608_c0_g1_i2.p1 TRINITY_DN35608_c0_g1~~TRINITY_DN35608_c0_g1_i2.p1  ORF type:complete len:139 (+),score=17.62 TRINITY_DN35608_c0_g1_i2:358-774(+)